MSNAGSELSPSTRLLPSPCTFPPPPPPSITLSFHNAPFQHTPTPTANVVVTHYFLDVPPNVLDTICNVASHLEEGGVWANFGP